MHYGRWLRNGDPTVTTRLPNGSHESCVADSCSRVDVAAQGLCNMHYARKLSHGDPTVSLLDRSPAVERFWNRTIQSVDGCWEWTGTINNVGYGSLSDGESNLAHRFAYELLVAPIPDGLQIDHLCNVRNCVNPAHLEAVTAQENMRRMSVRYQERKVTA
jgi:hypothetical protein